jgi:LCP family protein required for cell wall assembly
MSTLAQIFNREPSDPPPGDAGPRRGLRGWVGRHKALSVLVSLALVFGLVGVGAVVYLDHKLDQIPRLSADLGTGRDGEPLLSDVEPERGMDLLIAGVDNGNQGPGVRALARGDWQPGLYRSDTIMLMHFTAGWDKAYVVSFPRDSWVEVPGRGRAKINASFSWGGPGLLIETLKEMGAVDVNHLVVVDWDGFRSLTTELGGVDLDTPDGTVHLEGDSALEYVRARKTLPGGDFDRVKRQQNFLRAVSRELIRGGLLSSPLRFLDTINWAGSEVLLDDGFTNGEIRRLALNLRSFRPGDVTYLTAPVEGLGREGSQSVVRLDLGLTRELLGAFAADEVEAFLEEHPELERLGSEQRVN